MDSRYKFPDRYIDNRSPSISGIIAGICKGELWLDNWEAPRLAAAYSCLLYTSVSKSSAR